MSFTTKILVIRFSSIGDIMLTTPVVRCLQQQVHGDCEVHYLVKSQFVNILQINPYVDVIHLFKDNLKEVVSGLKDEGFHYVIDLHKNLRSGYVKRHLPGMHFTFNKLNVKKWILVNFGIDLLPDVHIVDRYFEAVKALGVVNDGKGLDYFIPESEVIKVSDRLGGTPGDYLVYAIGGAHEGKKLPFYKMDELCGLINKTMVLVGGKEDAANGAALAEKHTNVFSACGKTNIHGSASIIKQSRLVISHDSGMMHIAAAFKKKVISIWGATVPKFGMYPYLPDPASVMIQADHLKFRPTSKLGDRNSKRERRTTEELELWKIVDAVEALW